MVEQGESVSVRRRSSRRWSGAARRQKRRRQRALGSEAIVDGDRRFHRRNASTCLKHDRKNLLLAIMCSSIFCSTIVHCISDGRHACRCGADELIGQRPFWLQSRRNNDEADSSGGLTSPRAFEHTECAWLASPVNMGDGAGLGRLLLMSSAIGLHNSDVHRTAILTSKWRCILQLNGNALHRLDNQPLGTAALGCMYPSCSPGEMQASADNEWQVPPDSRWRSVSAPGFCVSPPILRETML